MSEHRYISTACQHHLHGSCRDECKYCDSVCLCPCHCGRKSRGGECGEPGPYDTHCTQPRYHDYSCYDCTDDSSWNEGSPQGWQEEIGHECDKRTSNKPPDAG